MTNKAKTYLKNIQETDTEKKLIGIEIAFKQDMTLSCNDLGSLCRAAEDRRYSLRNNEETLKLKQILFFRTKAEMDAYHDMSRKPEDWTEAEIEQQRSRFCSVWQVIEEAELVDEYEAQRLTAPKRYTPRKGAVPRIRCVLYKVAEMGNYLLVIQKSFLFRKMIFRGLLWRSFFFTHFCRKEEMPMATRGRKPKPTAMKELEGNPGKHPLNTSEPKPNKKAPACPKWLEPEAKKEWRRLAKQMEAIGILTEVDMAAFAGYCQAYARWKEAEAFITQHGTIVKTPSGYWQQVPQVSIAQTYLKIMNKFAEQFGLTPSSRSRIIASDGGPADAADEMENLLGGGGS